MKYGRHPAFTRHLITQTERRTVRFEAEAKIPHRTETKRQRRHRTRTLAKRALRALKQHRGDGLSIAEATERDVQSIRAYEAELQYRRWWGR